MNNRKSDSFLLPGKAGRKTGFKVTWTPKRGPNGLESVKDFFLSDDEFESNEQVTTSPVKRLSMRFKQLKELKELKILKQTKKAENSTQSPIKQLFLGNTHSKANDNEKETDTRNESQKEIIDESDNENANESDNNLSFLKSGQKKSKNEEIDKVDKPNKDTGKSDPVLKTTDVENMTEEEDITEDEDIDELIKNAEDIGTPIRIPIRPIASIPEYPKLIGDEYKAQAAVVSNTSKGSKLTKNMALNKSVKNSKFLQQNIVNMEPSTEVEKISTGMTSIEENINKDNNSSRDSIYESATEDKINSRHSRSATPEAVQSQVEKSPTKQVEISDKESNTNQKTQIEHASSAKEITKTLDINKSQKVVEVEKQIAQNTKKGGEAKQDYAIKVLGVESDDNIEDEQFDKETSLDENESDKVQESEKILELTTPKKVSPKKYKPITTSQVVKAIKAKESKSNSNSSDVEDINTRSKASRKMLQNNSDISHDDVIESEGDSVGEDTSVKEEIPNNEEEVENDSNAENSDGSDDDDEIEVVLKRHKNGKTSSITSGNVGPKINIKPRSSKKEEKPQKPVISSKLKLTKSKVTKPPVEPIRRSTRTRVKPVASWKNEKVEYKTEKVNGVFVKTVTNVANKPVVSLPPNSVSKRTNRSQKKVESIDLLSDNEVRASKRQRSRTTDKEEDTHSRKRTFANKTKPVEKVKRIVKSPEHKKLEKTTKKSKAQSNIKQSSVRSKELPKKSRIIEKPKTIQRKQLPETEDFDEIIPEEDISVDDKPETEWQRKKDGALTLSIFEGPGTEKQIERTVAFAPNSYKNVTIIKNDDEYFKVGTLFDQDCEFCGGGIIELPQGAKKAVKSNHDTYFIFYVIQGEIEVTLTRNTFVVTKGCSFEVPMGNYYQMANKGSGMAKMMFVQSKYIVISENASSESEDDVIKGSKRLETASESDSGDDDGSNSD